MEITILSASVNPNGYDIQALSRMSYDEAKDFFENDETGMCTVEEYVIDQSQEHEAKFHADGVFQGDGTDTMLNWLKVQKKNYI